MPKKHSVSPAASLCLKIVAVCAVQTTQAVRSAYHSRNIAQVKAPPVLTPFPHVESREKTGGAFCIFGNNEAFL